MEKKSYCSGIPQQDEATEDCCHQHDRAYGINGTGTRKAADDALYACIKAEGKPLFAWVVWIVIRALGWRTFRNDAVGRNT